MSQLVVYQAEEGIVLATDSHAVHYPGTDRREIVQVRKLFPLTPHAAMVTAGVGYGLPLCAAFQEHVKRAGIAEWEEILQRASIFFPSEVRRLQGSDALEGLEEGLHRLYIVVAGHDFLRTESPFRFRLLASEGPGDPLRFRETGPLVAIPRQMTLEYRLSRLSPSKNRLDAAEKTVGDFMKRLAEADDEIGPPFLFARITADGVLFNPPIRKARPAGPLR